MKKFKQFVFELKDSTYYSAASKLRDKGHHNRADNIEKNVNPDNVFDLYILGEHKKGYILKDMKIGTINNTMSTKKDKKIIGIKYGEEWIDRIYGKSYKLLSTFKKGTDTVYTYKFLHNSKIDEEYVGPAAMYNPHELILADRENANRFVKLVNKLIIEYNSDNNTDIPLSTANDWYEN